MTSMHMTRGDLFGREEERAVVLRFVEELAERPQVLLLEGEAGIGKTILWRAG
jgi:tRNA A37 threonylcarbamoyladenosine biosynthesis protein TsaE